VFASGPYLGLTLGPVLGGFVVQSAGWRGLFVAAGALSVLVCLIPVWNLSGIEWRVSAKTRFDAAGAALYGVALPVMLLGFTLLPRRPGMVLTITGAMGVFAFVLWETRAGDPLVDIHLFRSNRVLAGANVAAFANYAAVAAVTFLMSLYLQYTRGLDPQTAGIVLVAGAFVQAAFSPVAGKVVDRVNARTVAAAGMGLSVLGLLGLSFIGEQTPYGYVIGMTCLLGLGFAFFASPITHAVMGSAGSTHVGMASSTLAAVRWTGNNVSIAIAGLILSAAVGAGAIGPASYPQVFSAVRLSL
jgi:MFS family permease